MYISLKEDVEHATTTLYEFLGTEDCILIHHGNYLDLPRYVDT